MNGTTKHRAKFKLMPIPYFSLAMVKISNSKFPDHKKHYCISANLNLARVFWKQHGAVMKVATLLS